jgi:hypothetical protein
MHCGARLKVFTGASGTGHVAKNATPDADTPNNRISEIPKEELWQARQVRFGLVH